MCVSDFMSKFLRNRRRGDAVVRRGLRVINLHVLCNESRFSWDRKPPIEKRGICVGSSRTNGVRPPSQRVRLPFPL